MTIPIFLANPDSYGRFGHQTLRMLTPLLLARQMHGLFLPIRYSYFSAQWNNSVDFSQSALAVKSIKGLLSYKELLGRAIDAHGNSKYDLMFADQIGEINTEIRKLLQSSQDEYVLIRLPFDQSPGRLLSMCRSLDRKELARLFHFNQAASLDGIYESAPYVVVHVRRGDVTPERHPEWYIPNAAYCDILATINHAIPPHYEILVIGQGLSELMGSPSVRSLQENGRLRIICSENSFRTSDEVDCFRLMMGARLVVGSLSSFSYLAALISGQPFICVSNAGIIPSEWPANTYRLSEIHEGRPDTVKLNIQILDALQDQGV
jgi:hypothetical protein